MLALKLLGIVIFCLLDTLSANLLFHLTDHRYPEYITEDPRVTCSEIGSFHHPANCSWFYRCVDYMETGYFQVFFFQCEPGTIFLDELDQCVYGTSSLPPCSHGAPPSPAVFPFPSTPGHPGPATSRPVISTPQTPAPPPVISTPQTPPPPPVISTPQTPAPPPVISTLETSGPPPVITTPQTPAPPPVISTPQTPAPPPVISTPQTPAPSPVISTPQTPAPSPVISTPQTPNPPLPSISTPQTPAPPATSSPQTPPPPPPTPAPVGSQSLTQCRNCVEKDICEPGFSPSRAFICEACTFGVGGYLTAAQACRRIPEPQLTSEGRCISALDFCPVPGFREYEDNTILGEFDLLCMDSKTRPDDPEIRLRHCQNYHYCSPFGAYLGTQTLCNNFYQCYKAPSGRWSSEMRNCIDGNLYSFDLDQCLPQPKEEELCH